MAVNRNVIAAAGLLAVMVLINIGLDFDTGSPVDGFLTRLKMQVNDEQWPQAESTIQLVKGQWRRRKLWIAIGNDIQDVDSFERVLTQTEEYVKGKERVESSSRVAILLAIWRGFDN